MNYRYPVLALLFMSAILPASYAATQSSKPAASKPEAPLVSPDGPPSFVYPQRRMVEGNSLTLYAPQIRSWPNFERFEAQLALEFKPADGSAVRYATASVSGKTEVNLDSRLVVVRHPQVDKVTFTTSDTPAKYADVVKRSATRTQIDVPLDLFLAALADDVLDTSAPAGFNTKAPPIHVAYTPTILLILNGEPALQPMEKTKLQVVANANWPTVKETGGNAYYLLAGERWLTAEKPEGPWTPTSKLPSEFSKLSATGPNAAIRAAVPPKSSTQQAPAVLFSKVPAELIVIDGAAKVEPIANADGLAYMRNTATPLFRLGVDWYFLAAGRWFSTTKLNEGPWTFVSKLPDAFRSIPANHPMAAVRASVPGTTEARMAVLEAKLPSKHTVARNAAPPVKVEYADEPKFEPIATTQVARAVNTSFDVLQYQGKFYWCYQGIWYEGTSANGPWTVATSVPQAIYSIPPSSPSYSVTQVVVQQATPTTVIYSYPPSYSSNVYVAYGVVVYGTGWYYPPYYGYGYYYPYYGSYGYGTWYNPNTGGYGSRSVYYGPYGGYSYNQAYNPNTGRYGYVETAWDSNEWASYGQTYNPRTGVASETSRYYNEDTGRASMERTVQRGDQSMTTQRETDFKNQTQSVSRETSGGGSQEAQRQVENGQVTGSGTIQTAGGRTIETEAQGSGGQGSVSMSGSGGGSGTVDVSHGANGTTREGSFTTGSGDTVTSNTQRSGTSSRTEMESSSGGQLVSGSEGGNRTTLAQSGSGDLYAGHDGNVYRKTEDGWSHYENGSWDSVDRPSQPRAAETRSQSPSSRDMSQLNRDYSARQTGNRQFSSRAGGFGGGGGRRR